MKAGSIKAPISAILLGLTLTLSGCATTQQCESAPAENRTRQVCGDKSENQEVIKKAPAPAQEGGDDMERLD